MRRTERHHLKENALAEWLADVRAGLRRGGRTAAVAGGLVLALLITTAAAYGWQQWRSARASELLAAAMAIVDAVVVAPPAESEIVGDTAESAPEPFVQPPGSYPSMTTKLEEAVPRLLEAAEAYPTLMQGISARYQAAAALSALGRTDQAHEQYQFVIELAGDEIYGRMARLGLAETHLKGGAFEDAIALLEQESTGADTEVPRDAVLMRLGRAYDLAEQPSDAITAFSRIVDEYPASPYAQDARREVEALGAGQ